MHTGIIIFEDGSVMPIGTLTSVRKMIATMQRIIQELEQQERQQLLSTITDDELKELVDRLSEKKK